jgi:hypothetical protein
MEKTFPHHSGLRQAYSFLSDKEISDVCMGPAQQAKIQAINLAKTEKDYIETVFAIKKFDAPGTSVKAGTGAGTDFTFYELIAAYHQSFLCLPKDINTAAGLKSASPDAKKAYAR